MLAFRAWAFSPSCSAANTSSFLTLSQISEFPLASYSTLCHSARINRTAAMFWRDLQLAWRSAFRNPGYSFLIVAVLAIGIGANTAIFGRVPHARFLSVGASPILLCRRYLKNPITSPETRLFLSNLLVAYLSPLC